MLKTSSEGVTIPLNEVLYLYWNKSGRTAGQRVNGAIKGVLRRQMVKHVQFRGGDLTENLVCDKINSSHR